MTKIFSPLRFIRFVLCWTSAKWDGFGNREIRLVSAASTGDNKAETSRRTNIASGTGYGGRSLVKVNTFDGSVVPILDAAQLAVFALGSVFVLPQTLIPTT